MYPPDQQHRLIEVARVADELGVDCIDTTDHVLIGEGALSSRMGWQRHHLDMPFPEPLTVLAAMSGVTKQIKLLSAVVISPLRPAGLLAKQAATVHALSQGRFVMGVSVSWHFDEYEALNVPFHRRGQVLDDQLRACRVLWTEAPASFHSETVNFEGMHCSPRPGPTERIPIWFGGFFTPRLVRRVTELGDGWLVYGGLGMSLSQKADAVRELRAAYAAAGRDPRSLEVCDEVEPLEGDLPRSMAQIPQLAAAGITSVRVHLRRFAATPNDVLKTLEETVNRFEEYKRIEV
jgi:probable F420-dependent oxidoreductase